MGSFWGPSFPMGATALYARCRRQRIRGIREAYRATLNEPVSFTSTWRALPVLGLACQFFSTKGLKAPPKSRSAEERGKHTVRSTKNNLKAQST